MDFAKIYDYQNTPPVSMVYVIRDSNLLNKWRPKERFREKHFLEFFLKGMFL
jgi:hypothetical protein